MRRPKNVPHIFFFSQKLTCVSGQSETAWGLEVKLLFETGCFFLLIKVKEKETPTEHV